MKKVFVEPSIKKIELNMTENIAASGQIIGYHFLTTMLQCPIQDTGLTIFSNFKDEDVVSCLMYASEASEYGTVVSRSKVRRYMK